jgi:hypothetical protein
MDKNGNNEPENVDEANADPAPKPTGIPADIANIAASIKRADPTRSLANILVSDSFIDKAARSARLSATAQAAEQARSIVEGIGGTVSLREYLNDANSATALVRRYLDSPTQRLIRESGFTRDAIVRATGSFGAVAEINRQMAESFRHTKSLHSFGLEPSLAEKLVRQNLALNDTLASLAGVGSFGRLAMEAKGFGRTNLDQWAKISEEARALVSGGFSGRALASAMRMNWPANFPEYRRPTVAEIAAAPLGSIASSLFASRDALEVHRQSMRRLRSPWVDVDNPLGSITALGEARALAELARRAAPQSRKLITPLRDELGDYRQADQLPDDIAGDPVLRTLAQHEHGFSTELASLAPAAVAAIAASLGIHISVDVSFDEEELSMMLFRHTRRLELKLRRFIDARMRARFGNDWLKHRADGKLREVLAERRETGKANGRKASALFDYADFQDYVRIIERSDNWKEVFAPIFVIKVAFVETMRRLALVRNPTAHFRIVTIEDLLMFAVEARHLNRWLDEAAPDIE